MLGAFRIARTATKTGVRNINFATSLQKNVWKKSTARYIATIGVACIFVEVFYGCVTTSIWNVANYGKLYHQIDWSKFKTDEEEDEE